MEFEFYFPIWDKLNKQQQGLIKNSLSIHQVKKGAVIHNGSMDCTGLLLIKSGQLRAYILSDEGREITIYRLFDFVLRCASTAASGCQRKCHHARHEH